jgi:uncharacterized protein (TIGR02145 family)
MKNIYLLIIIVLLGNLVYGQSVYTFTGKGNWSDTANWVNNIVPPDTLTEGSFIYISPAEGDTCFLDRPQVIGPDASLVISTGAQFVNAGELHISYQQYPNVTICDQIWMKRNLGVVTYNNGDTIPQITDAAEWVSATTGAWCYYNNDSTTEAVYGKLYNYPAVSDPRGLAPTGWHVPNNLEWQQLFLCLGGTGEAGGKMKETGTRHWQDPNAAATNSSGFTGLPGGGRDYGGSFFDKGLTGLWWTSDAFETGGGHCRLFHDSGVVSIYNVFNAGLSVRCIKNIN